MRRTEVGLLTTGALASGLFVVLPVTEVTSVVLALGTVMPSLLAVASGLQRIDRSRRSFRNRIGVGIGLILLSDFVA